MMQKINILENISNSHSTNEQTTEKPAWQMVAGLIIGVGIIVTVLLFVWHKLAIGPAQFALLKVILAIGAAGVAVLFLGNLSIQGKLQQIGIKAGGAFAVFVLVLLVQPAPIPINPPSTAETPQESKKTLAPYSKQKMENSSQPDKQATNIVNSGIIQENINSKVINTEGTVHIENF